MNANLFLTPTVWRACDDALGCYLQVLAHQQSVSQPIDWLGRMMDQSRNNLDDFWQVASSSATAGNVQDGIALLICIIREWGTYRAFTDLIDADAHGVVLDLTDPDVSDNLQQGIQQAIVNKVTALATELTTAFLAGWVEWEKAGQNELVQGYSSLQHVNLEIIQHQRTALQQYADTELRRVEQAQQGVYWMAQFVQSHGSYMVGGMQAIQDHLKQGLPSAIADARSKRTSRLLLVVLGICSIMIALIIVACVLGPTIVQR